MKRVQLIKKVKAKAVKVKAAKPVKLAKVFAKANVRAVGFKTSHKTSTRKTFEIRFETLQTNV